MMVEKAPFALALLLNTGQHKVKYKRRGCKMPMKRNPSTSWAFIIFRR
jgi:hypothetical protein